MKEFSIKLGQNLKHARLVSGMSQTEVAEKLGVASTVLCSWEHGRHYPGPAYLVKLADCYGCSVDLLLGRAK